MSTFYIAPMSRTNPTNQKRTGPCVIRLKNGPIFTSCKMTEFFEKSPLSGAEKHPDFQVTLCLQNVSTSVDFAYIESE